MKKNITVSLGGMAFTMEDDAYKRFDSYIGSLREKLGDSKDTDEIIRDIEERASELFSNLQGKSPEVTLDMVEEVIGTLGDPDEIADSGTETRATHETDPTRIRRLFRDGEHAIVAGVCSGLGAYFNVDPVIFRILFIFLFFLKGIGLLLYIPLWIFVPRARTAKHRLEMQGSPVNFSNIEKDLKREYEEIRKNLNKKKVSDTVDRGISTFSKIFTPILLFFGILVRFLGIIMAIVLVITGSLALIAVVGSFFFGGLSYLSPSFTEFSVQELLVSTFDLGSVAWIAIPLFIIIAIPLLSLVFLGIRILFNFRLRSTFILSSAASIWILAIVVLAITIFYQIHSFTIRETVTEIHTLQVPQGTNKIYLESSTAVDSLWVEPFETLVFDEYTMGVVESGLSIYGKPSVTFGMAESNRFEMIVEKRSRGGTRSGAIKNAQNVHFAFTLQDSLLKLSPHFLLPKGQQWRVQEVDIIINLPRNHSIYIDPSLFDILDQNQESCQCWPDELVGKTWIMRQNGMVEQ